MELFAEHRTGHSTKFIIHEKDSDLYLGSDGFFTFRRHDAKVFDTKELANFEIERLNKKLIQLKN